MSLEISIEILEDIRRILTDMKSSPKFNSELGKLLALEVDYLKEYSSSDKKSDSRSKEVATIGVGTKVSWNDHIGSFSGIITEVHFAKVRRVVKNIRMWNDGAGYEHEITRVGTYRNPALVIEIIGGSGGTALKLMNQINIDELVL